MTAGCDSVTLTETTSHFQCHVIRHVTTCHVTPGGIHLVEAKHPLNWLVYAVESRSSPRLKSTLTFKHQIKPLLFT